MCKLFQITKWMSVSRQLELCIFYRGVSQIHPVKLAYLYHFAKAMYTKTHIIFITLQWQCIKAERSNFGLYTQRVNAMILLFQAVYFTICSKKFRTPSISCRTVTLRRTSYVDFFPRGTVLHLPPPTYLYPHIPAPTEE